MNNIRSINNSVNFNHAINNPGLRVRHPPLHWCTHGKNPNNSNNPNNPNNPNSPNNPDNPNSPINPNNPINNPNNRWNPYNLIESLKP